MYIMIIARGFPTDRYKLNGIFEFDQAKALAAEGHKVVLVALDLRSIRRFRKFGHYSFVKDGVLVESVNVPCGRIPKRVLYYIGRVSLKRAYKHICLKLDKPDIIHSHFTDIGYITSKVFCNNTIPLVMTEHSSKIPQIDPTSALFKVAMYTYENSDKVIAVSNMLVIKINDHFSVKADRVPNIASTDLFIYKSHPKDKTFKIISTGSLVKIKRMDLLIDAFCDAFSDKDNVELKIFGGGPEEQNLKDRIKENNLHEKITIMGTRPRHEIAKYLMEGNCFALASDQETFGVAYVEALATGNPVIATKCGGPEDFVNSENGIFINIDDREGLAKALLHMYNNSEKYDRNKISEEIKKEFSPEVIAKKLISIYKTVLANKS